MADSALPPPAEGLEYKSTKDTVIGYTAATVPNWSRSGTQLTDDERKAADKVVGSPAQGNDVPNSNLAGVGDHLNLGQPGLTTASGGTFTAPGALLGGKPAPAAAPAPKAAEKPAEAPKATAPAAPAAKPAS